MMMLNFMDREERRVYKIDHCTSFELFWGAI